MSMSQAIIRASMLLGGACPMVATDALYGRQEELRKRLQDATATYPPLLHLLSTASSHAPPE
jgi:hypothetical protein